MFDKNKFAIILKNINDTYDSQRDFSKKSEINRTYLSQYMNMKLDEPPKPIILKKIADTSNGVVSYEELMEICGYINKNYHAEFNNLNTELHKAQYEYAKKLKNLALSKQEEAIYKDLEKTIPISRNYNCSVIELNKKINSYFETQKYIDDLSKNRIVEKINLTLYYYKLISNMHEKLCILQYDYEKALYNLHLPLEKNNSSKTKYFMCPVYGQISAEQPNWAEECIEGRLPIDPELMNIVDPEECFFLRVIRRINESTY